MDSSVKCKGKVVSTEIIKECGEHTKALITVVPDDIKDINSLLSFAKIGEIVEVSLDDSLIMYGTIYNVSGSIKYTGAAVQLEVVSDSIESDTTKASRIFQSPQKTMQCIFDKLNNKKYKFSFNGNKSSESVDEVLIQNNETDFEFVSRIASEYGLKVFDCSDERGVCNIIIAESLSKMIRLEEKNIISFLGEYNKHHEVFEIQYSEYIELGTKVNLNGNDYIVVQVRAIRKDDINSFFYRIEQIKSIWNSNSHPTNLISIGKAKVTDNKDPESLGRIQVDFLDVEDVLNDSKAWIKYINLYTAINGGTIMIPDIGEYVEVIYQNNECFAYGCVREQKIHEKVDNPGEKSIYLFDKLLTFRKDSIIFETEKYSAELNNTETYFQNDNCSIHMYPDHITLENKKSTVQIDTEKVHVCVNNNSCIDVTDKDIILQISNSKFKIDSHKAELKANRFDVQ